jgi:hypothetical protein
VAQRAELGVHECGEEPVPGKHITTVIHDARWQVEGIEHLSHRRPDRLGAGRAWTCPAGIRQVEEVDVLVLGEPQRAGDRVEDRLRHVLDAALLHPRAVVGADPGELGEFGAPVHAGLPRPDQRRS